MAVERNTNSHHICTVLQTVSLKHDAHPPGWDSKHKHLGLQP